MSPSQLRIIMIGLVALLVLWGGSELLSRGSDRMTGSLALAVVPDSLVDSITLIKGRDSILLTRDKGTTWSVNGHRAAVSAVSDLLHALKDTTRPELVAQDPSSFARLSVDSATGRWVTLRGRGKERLALVVGGRGPDYQSLYVRRPGDRHVYLWRGQLAALVDRGADDWRDKRIAALEPDSIGGLEVERGTDRYALRRTGKTWALSVGKVDSAAVARYLERLRAIMAQGFVAPHEADSVRAARAKTRRLLVRGARGDVLLSLAFDSTTTGYLVRHLAGVGGEGATIYRMNSWDVDGVTPASRSLSPTPTPTPAPSKPTKP
jgi:uncharacterized protein DUF4340